MRNKYLFPLFAALMSLLPSCVRPDDISSDPLLKLSGRIVTVAAEGGEASIAFTLSDAGSGKTLEADAALFHFSCQAAWCGDFSADPAAGKITFRVDPNVSESSRLA